MKEINAIEYTFGPYFPDNETALFRLWAPTIDSVRLRLDRIEHEMDTKGDGWHTSPALPAPEGTPYCFVMPDGLTVPDPASRQQSDDVHGMSRVRRPTPQTTITRVSVPWESTVVYELHVGTATTEGSFLSLIPELPALQAAGVTVIELLPVADFPGRWNWGYDGVLPFAPDTQYGTPEDLRTLINAAHDLGLAVWMDVVYNHFGPEGNYLHVYAKRFFSPQIETPWGAGIDFSVPEVRRFFIENALYWTQEFGIDGLRVDAVHAIEDPHEPHFIDELVQTVERSHRDPVRIVLENERNESRFLRATPSHPVAADAQWNDDLHHALHVLITGETSGYYRAYAADTERLLARGLSEGFMYQGEPSPTHGGAARGEPSADLRPTRFISFLQNHDQIGNRAFGERITSLAPSDAVEAALTVVLLAPQIPMLFMGELWLAEAPFQFFCDFEHDLAEAVREGRKREFGLDAIPDPIAAETRNASRPGSCESNDSYRLVSSLLSIRHRELVPLLSNITRSRSAGGIDHALTVSWESSQARWVMVINLADHVRPIAADIAIPDSVPVWPAAMSSSATAVASSIEPSEMDISPWSVRIWKETT